MDSNVFVELSIINIDVSGGAEAEFNIIVGTLDVDSMIIADKDEVSNSAVVSDVATDIFVVDEESVNAILSAVVGDSSDTVMINSDLVTVFSEDIIVLSVIFGEISVVLAMLLAESIDTSDIVVVNPDAATVSDVVESLATVVVSITDVAYCRFR